MSKIIRYLDELWWRFQNSSLHWTQYIAGIAIPVIIVGVLFTWRVQEATKKKNKRMRQRHKLLEQLQASRKEGPVPIEAAEEEDEVVAEAIRLMEEKAKKYK